MYTISPIGSCRITTPLRSGQNRHGIKLNLQRCYGYCHSPAEAVQLAKFMQEDHAIPEAIWPLICRSNDFETISAQKHEPSDLYVIELASAKELTIDGVSVQLNYLRQAFPEFFSDEKRLLQFWELAASDGPAATSAFLDEHWSATEDQARDTAVLSRLELKFSDRDSLRENILQLTELLPDVVFVSHVDALKLDGQPISSRSNFIKMVQEEVSALGLNFYDPTLLMHEFGQSAAIEDDSTSLAHFTPAFSDAIMNQWMEQFVEPSTNRRAPSDDDAANRVLLPQIDAAIKHGKLAATMTRLEALSSENQVANSALHRLGERLAKEQDGLRSTAASAKAPIDAAEAEQMVSQAGHLGLFDLALELILQTDGGFQAFSAHRMIELACAAHQSGDDTNAFEFALAAFHKGAPPRARALLTSISLKAQLNLLGEIERNLWPDLLAGLPVVDRLALLENADVAPSSMVDKDWPSQDVADFAFHLNNTGAVEEAQRVVHNWQTLQNGKRITDPAIAGLVVDWCRDAVGIEDNTQRICALADLSALFPKQKSLVEAIRDERLALMDRIRDAGKNDDLESVLAMQEDADTLPGALPDFELWKARLHFNRSNFAETLSFAPYATETMGDRIGVWVMLMRAADKHGDTEQSHTFADRVIALAGPDDVKLRAEAQAVADLQTAVGA